MYVYPVASKLFFVVRGEAEVFDDLESKPVATLGPGQHFGELSLLNDSPCNAFVRAKRTVMLYALKKQTLSDVLVVFPDVGETMRGIARARSPESEAASEIQATRPARSASNETF